MKQVCLIASLVAACAEAAAAPVWVNPSFESSNVGPHHSLQGFSVHAEGWIFSGAAGIAHKGVTPQPPIPDGDYYAFLRNTGSISQTFYSDGDYWIDFTLYWASFERASGATTVMSVYLDGTLILDQVRPPLDWSAYSLGSYALGAGNHNLTFRAAPLFGGTLTTTHTFRLDEVAMTARPLHEPEHAVPAPATAGLLCLAMVALGVSRRSRA